MSDGTGPRRFPGAAYLFGKSDYFHAGVGGEEFEDFGQVDFFGATGEAGIPENSAQGLAASDGFDNGGGDLLVKAGDEVTVVVGVDGAAIDGLAAVGHREGQAPLQQAAEQQVESGAIWLDVGFHHREHILGIVVRGEIDIPHIGIVQLKDTEAGVQCGGYFLLRFSRCFRRGKLCVWFPFLQRTRPYSIQKMCIYFYYLLPCTADAFFANVADGFVAGFVGFALFVTGFWQLHPDKFAVAAVLGVELHDGVGGGG